LVCFFRLLFGFQGSDSALTAVLCYKAKAPQKNSSLFQTAVCQCLLPAQKPLHRLFFMLPIELFFFAVFRSECHNNIFLVSRQEVFLTFFSFLQVFLTVLIETLCQKFNGSFIENAEYLCTILK